LVIVPVLSLQISAQTRTTLGWEALVVVVCCQPHQTRAVPLIIQSSDVPAVLRRNRLLRDNNIVGHEHPE
jgi:hypothetical protein